MQKLGLAKSLKQLSTYAGTGEIPDQPEEVRAMFERESDRGVIIVMASLAEDRLRDSIMRNMRALSPRQQDLLFRENGPLSSFPAKIRMASALGVIDDEAEAALHALRSIRNACAHSTRDISFETPELRTVLLAMIEGDLNLDGARGSIWRLVFFLVCKVRFDQIDGATKEVAEKNVSDYLRAITDEIDALPD